MTIEKAQPPNPSLHAHPDGYVPAAREADGNEDPTPVDVANAGALPEAQPASVLPTPDGQDAGTETAVAEEVSFDQQPEASRRVGRLPEADAPADAGRPDIADAVAESLGTPAATDPARK